MRVKNKDTKILATEFMLQDVTKYIGRVSFRRLTHFRLFIINIKKHIKHFFRIHLETF